MQYKREVLKYNNGFRNRKIDGCTVTEYNGFLTLVNRIIWQKPHNCGFFYVKFIKF